MAGGAPVGSRVPGVRKRRNARLLELGEDRIRTEIRRAAELRAADRYWRTRSARFVLRLLGTYAFGVFLIGFSLHTTNYDIARWVVVAGFLVAGLGPMFVGVRTWLDEAI